MKKTVEYQGQLWNVLSEDKTFTTLQDRKNPMIRRSILSKDLEPYKCKFCGSFELVYSQAIGEEKCQECGRWQCDNDYIEN